MKELLKNPYFALGLGLKLLVFMIMLPHPISDWYIPFLSNVSQNLTLDPWHSWMSQGGDPAAFPYGLPMLISFLPTLLFAILGVANLKLVYFLNIVLFDVGLLLLLQLFFQKNKDKFLIFYWLSPISIIGCYALGFNDIVPVFYLFFALLKLQKGRVKTSAFFLATAIGAKLSMAIVLPFVIIYMYRNRLDRIVMLKYSGISALVLGAVYTPVLYSTDAMKMLFGIREITNIFHLYFGFDKNRFIFIVPMVYMILLAVFASIKRIHFQLFLTMLGMIFLCVVLLTPASPGWFVWALPILVQYQLLGSRFSKSLLFMFSIFYALTYIPGIWDLLVQNVWIANYAERIFHMDPSEGALAFPLSVSHTLLITTGLLIVYRIWRDGVKQNDFFLLAQKPYVVGIAGDSGAGKDTFSDALVKIFGPRFVTTVSGDDYHLWDRHKPMWQAMTHLNPMANDLESYTNAIRDLSLGKSILSSHYDHKTGKMSKRFLVNSNNFVIASGLHALHLPSLRGFYDTKIYLDIDEGLRRAFKLRRDVHQRGHPREKVLASFERREPDAQKFIRPQLQFADLVFSLKPLHPRMLSEGFDLDRVRFKLEVISHRDLNERMLLRVLVGVCGLHVEYDSDAVTGHLRMIVEGEPTAEDMRLASQLLCASTLQFLNNEPEWQDGITGVMQLIALVQIEQTLLKRAKV